VKVVYQESERRPFSGGNPRMGFGCVESRWLRTGGFKTPLTGEETAWHPIYPEAGSKRQDLP